MILQSTSVVSQLLVFLLLLPLNQLLCSGWPSPKYLKTFQLMMGNLGTFASISPSLLFVCLFVLFITSSITFYPPLIGKCPKSDNLNEADVHTFHTPLQYELNILF